MPLGRALVGSLVVNALTHPVLYAALLATDAPGAFLAAEAAVVVVEALVLTRLWRVPVQSAWLWVTAVLVNGLSILGGAALMSVSR